MIYLKFVPKDGTVRCNTNIGEFMAGQYRGPFQSVSDINEAKRLIACGDFIEVDSSGHVDGELIRDSRADTKGRAHSKTKSQ